MATRASTKSDTDAKTEQPPVEGQLTTAGNRSVAEHAEHPDQPADSTVKHVAQPLPGEGPGGFPQGEYDVTTPAPEAAKAQAEAKDAAIKQLVEAANVGTVAPLDDVIAQALEDSQLEESEVLKVTEALPVGIVIEHDAPNRWRLHKLGSNHFGHGATYLAALEDYLLGGAGRTIDAVAAKAFTRLPETQQQEILARDDAAAAPASVNPLVQARQAARERTGTAPGLATGPAKRITVGQATAKRAAAEKRTSTKQGTKTAKKAAKR